MGLQADMNDSVTEINAADDMTPSRGPGPHHLLWSSWSLALSHYALPRNTEHGGLYQAHRSIHEEEEGRVRKSGISVEACYITLLSTSSQQNCE